MREHDIQLQEYKVSAAMTTWLLHVHETFVGSGSLFCKTDGSLNTTFTGVAVLGSLEV